VREVLSLSANGTGILSEQEVLVQRLVVAVVDRRGHDTTPELEAVVRSIGPAKTIAVLMLIGRYMSHAMIVNTLNLPAPVPSPLGDEAVTAAQDPRSGSPNPTLCP